MTSPKTGKNFEVGRSDNFSLLVPAAIDDYGFTAEEFRLFARIMRRVWGSDQDCYESIPNLAKALFISERLVRRALNVLEACGAITRTLRPGKSDLYDFNPTEKWKPSRELPVIRGRIEAEMKRKDRLRKSPSKLRVVAETTGVSGCGNVTTPLAETTPLLVAETQDEGIPIEGIPIKKNTTDAPASLAFVSPPVEVVVSPASKPSVEATTEAGDETFWDIWIRIEKKQGILEATARKRLGSLIKQFGAELVSSAIGENLSAKADAFAYLKGTLANLQEKAAAQKLENERWLGEQRFVEDKLTRQMIQNPYFGDPRYLPNFPVPNLIPEWYRGTTARLQMRQQEVRYAA